jgi:hypothetical protein
VLVRCLPSTPLFLAPPGHTHACFLECTQLRPLLFFLAKVSKKRDDLVPRCCFITLDWSSSVEPAVVPLMCPSRTPLGREARSIKPLHRHIIEGTKHQRVEGIVLKTDALKGIDSVDVRACAL